MCYTYLHNCILRQEVNLNTNCIMSTILSIVTKCCVFTFIYRVHAIFSEEYASTYFYTFMQGNTTTHVVTAAKYVHHDIYEKDCETECRFSEQRRVAFINS